ncbi:sulfatase-like hydrolase/transferase [Arenibacter algicola]|uniref:sulfatase-like hydrolase/transferase n=1 Tax=Arenibacter algicola TaxID=616991 RepID=UPI001C073129|nr:sulfatase-like hydrolase/transferase [Arenibacter algicola]MBU2905360.1 sulfatase-like hydrolase/transferase [Arenibacter algicola]
MIIFNEIKLLFMMVALLLTNCGMAQDSRPNILVVLCDDLGYNDVGFNGSKDIKTPELDKLAHGGTIFTSAYVAHPFCGPSRSAILTGRYPHFTGTAYNLFQNSSEEDEDNMGVPIEETFMSKILQEAGYYTSAVGKWHLGAAPKFHPNKRGFDNFYGFLGGGHDYFPEKYRKVYQEQVNAGNKNIRDYLLPLEHNGKPAEESEYLTDAFSREAIRDIKTATENKKPFFVYLAYNAPHVPLQAKSEDLKKFENIKDTDRRTYAAMVYAVDRGVGQIVKTLKETNQYENTLIVFMSDNGGNTDHGADNYPLKGTKGDTWEGGYRVPMFFHWPKKIKGSQFFDFPVSALDLYPTFVQLAKTKVSNDKKLDGKDIMAGVLAGTDSYKNQMIYSLRYREGYSDVGGRQGDWKITRMANEPWGLFNIKEDIGEKKNLSGKFPERLEKMVSETEKWTKDFVRPLWYYSVKDQEYWNDGRMPRYEETFEISKLVTHPNKN